MRRTGFTLVELVVTLLVIALLIVLLLPAIQTSREAAKISWCRNNLKMIGMALLNYHDAHQHFPAGVEFMGAHESPLLWSWQSRILPYLEHDHLYRQLDFSAGVAAPQNQTLRGTPIREFQCPYDDESKRVYWQPEGPFSGSWALTNYLGVSGSKGVIVVGSVGLLSPGECATVRLKSEVNTASGVFYEDSFVSIAQIRDGASLTIMAGERGVPGDRAFGWWTGPGLADACPGGWADVVLPGSDNLGIGGLRRRIDTDTDAYHWWSHHRDGVPFLYCDGSVRTISYQMPAHVLRALCTRDGGERIPDEYR